MLSHLWSWRRQHKTLNNEIINTPRQLNMAGKMNNSSYAFAQKASWWYIKRYQMSIVIKIFTRHICTCKKIGGKIWNRSHRLETARSVTNKCHRTAT